MATIGELTQLGRGRVVTFLIAAGILLGSCSGARPDAYDAPAEPRAAAVSAPVEVAPPGVVSTTSGSFQGAAPDANGVVAFKGMPYAAPPVGPLRWRPPQPALATAGVQPALEFGDACLAAPGLLSSPLSPQSEDCLTINVWTPDLNPTASKPVMVWLHGGGFQFGSSAEATYDGAKLAGRDVVVVSLNYRLGVFGFLAASRFDQESGSSGDWGLQDQVAALRWVQQNIRRFGGDPRRVTLFGESAGAHSVGILLASPKARGLFSRAIIQSGAVWDSEHGSISSHAQALTKGNQFLARFAGLDARLLPAAVVNAAAPWDYLSDPGITAFAPSVDGDLLPDTPMTLLREGRQPAVPMLGGWNAAEYVTFVGRALPGAPPELFYAAASKLFGPACMPQFMAVYPQTDPTNALASSFQLVGDMVIAQQTWETLLTQRRRSRSYAYRFEYTSASTPIALHTAEVPFVFGGVEAADQPVSDMMMSYWTNFARQGDPNGPGLPTWPTLDAGGSQILLIDGSPAAAENPDLARFRFLAGYRSDGRLPPEWRTPGAQYQGPCPNS